MPTHRINLRGPWDYSWVENNTDSTRPQSLAGTISMPREWREIFGEISGTAIFRRKFHRPTNLDAHEQVWIVLTEVCGNGTVELNRLAVSSFTSNGQSFECEVTSLLQPFNELAVQLSFDAANAMNVPGGLFGVVTLEIRSP